MASNKTPRNGGLLISLARKMIGGIKKIGASVPVTMVTAEEMEAQLAPFIAADNAYNKARSVRQKASDAYQAATSAVYDWLLAARLALVPILGLRWSTAWAQAGFIRATTAIPSTVADRLTLIASLESFFKDNPGYQSPSTGVTAAKATALIATVELTQEAVTDEDMAFDDAGTAWQLAYDPLAASATALIKNLEGKLDSLDPRWLGFGLQMPGASSTPGKPTGLSAHLDEMGNVILQCNALALATRFRWRGFIVGVEVDYRLVASTTEPMASVDNVMPGQTMQFAVQGVNDTLQGVLSDPIQFTMPPVNKGAKPIVTAAAETKAVELLAPARPNGNGHATENGHRKTGRS